MSATQPLWDLSGHVARARHPRAQATIDLWSPWQGLRLQAWDDVPLAGCALLGVEFPGGDAVRGNAAAAPDCYVREGDLVATYPAIPERPSRVQAYWRLHPATDRLLLDVQVSVQTHLLDARPTLRLVSRAPRAAVSRFDVRTSQGARCDDGFRVTTGGGQAGGFVIASDGWQYVEMLHPDDPGVAAVSIRDGVALTHELFDGQLEKGVILRARARGVFAFPTEDGLRAATEAYREFLSEPLPLST